MSYDSRRASTKVFMHPIKPGLGLYIYQGWELLVYLPESFYHSSQCFDIFRK